MRGRRRRRQVVLLLALISSWASFGLLVVFSIGGTWAAHTNDNDHKKTIWTKAVQELQQQKQQSSIDTSSLYRLAKQWQTQQQEQHDDALVLYHILADDHNHILSMTQLANHYASSASSDTIALAISYFQKAGEQGPHHASLYNAGRLLLMTTTTTTDSKQTPTTYDLVAGIAYLQAAATLHDSYDAKYISESTTQAAQQALEAIQSQIVRDQLNPPMTMKELADAFVYYSKHNDGLAPAAQDLWKQAVLGLMDFNQTFVETQGQGQNQQAMTQVVVSLTQLWKDYQTSLSDLQVYLLLDNLNDMLGPLAALAKDQHDDDGYLALAALYAERLAFSSTLCYEYAAQFEDEGACFNGAAASAVSYYQRLGNLAAADRIVQQATVHPRAATRWTTALQTPRVHTPGLTAQPWWKEQDFSAARTLEFVYRKYKKQILKELNQVKKLQEGRLRAATSVQVDSDGTVLSNDEDDTNDLQGLQRIFTPYIGVRTETSEASTSGAGGWAEFGPLFNGTTWDQGHCQLVPTLCQALQDDKSLCTTAPTKYRRNNNNVNVWRECGADTVVTILRLRPGTSILPHCGTTNARLILHFALEGAAGVEFTVGKETRVGYGKGDGHAIVFDDSFEHSVYHGGKQDRFVLLAVLAHPDLIVH